MWCMYNVCCVLVCVVALSAEGWGRYQIPEVLIEVYPKGFTASIPDDPGIRGFTFSANLNNAITTMVVGTFYGGFLKSTAGRWQYRSAGAVLKKGDTLHYWFGVLHEEGLGLRTTKIKAGLYQFNGTYADEVIAPEKGNFDGTTTTPAWCVLSATTVRGRRACTGQIIFEDNFDQLTNNWQFEQKLPTAHPEYPFVSYQSLASVITVTDGKLSVTPSLLQTLPPYSIDSIQSGYLDLFRGCTEAADSCSMRASGWDILPPVVSGRASTKHSFTFKYGIVDIRAKLSTGDWLYPEILLEPLMSKYGREHFNSGVVKVAMSRSNQELRTQHTQIGSKQLYGGVALDHLSCYENLFVSKTSEQYWSSDYHTYTVRWDTDGFTWSVDGEQYGSVPAPPGGYQETLQNCSGMTSVFERWTLGTKMAPFDEEFYVTLGLAAGGISVFPDGSVTRLGRNKPWMNRASKAKLHFWQDAEHWYSTWSEGSVLLVDSVKVTAL